MKDEPEPLLIKEWLGTAMFLLFLFGLLFIAICCRLNYL